MVLYLDRLFSAPREECHHCHQHQSLFFVAQASTRRVTRKDRPFRVFTLLDIAATTEIRIRFMESLT